MTVKLSGGAGVVILLFVAGVVPFSSLIFLLVAFFLFASCIQYNILARTDTQHTRPGIAANLPAWQNAQRIQRAAVLSMLGTFGLGNPAFRDIITDPAAGGSLHNLRLSMMNRDFTDAGKYKSSHPTVAAQSTWTSHTSGMSCCTVLSYSQSNRICCSNCTVELPLFSNFQKSLTANAADYDMLLQLDQADNTPVPAAFEEQIGSLPSYKYAGSKVHIVLCSNALALHSMLQTTGFPDKAHYFQAQCLRTSCVRMPVVQ